MKKELRKCNFEIFQLKRIIGKTIAVFGLSASILIVAAPIPLKAAVIVKERNQTMGIDSLIEQQKDMKNNVSFYEPEKSPEFPGGEKALIEYLQKNIRHSIIDSLANSNYTYVQFAIDHDGRVIKPSIIHKIHPLVDSEVLRVISSLPCWQPAMLGDTTVQVRCYIHFSFSQSAGMKVSLYNGCILYSEVYDIVHSMPDFPGGQAELMKFIASNSKVPSYVTDNGITGRTIIRFIVDKEGNILKPRVVRSVDPYLDKEALRVIKLMPKWKPGELEDGTKVAVRFTVPVMFRLQ